VASRRIEAVPSTTSASLGDSLCHLRLPNRSADLSRSNQNQHVYGFIQPLRMPNVVLTMPSNDLPPIPILPATTLLELRISKLKRFGTVLLGIDKKATHIPLYVSPTGLTDDEHDLTFHGGIDKAIHQYDHSHYAFWQSRHPQAAAKFVAGGFGENFVAEVFTENNICIGDVVRVGPKNSILIGVRMDVCSK
jgi:hypothetical protein